MDARSRAIRHEVQVGVALLILIVVFLLAPGCSPEANSAAACGAFLLTAFVVAALAILARSGGVREWVPALGILALLAILITLCCVVLVPSSSSP
jgi:hypothetical protein